MVSPCQARVPVLIAQFEMITGDQVSSTTRVGEGTKSNWISPCRGVARACVCRISLISTGLSNHASYKPVGLYRLLRSEKQKVAIP